MLKFLLIGFSALTLSYNASALAQEQCSSEAHNLSASYTITTARKQGPETTSAFVLWRHNNTVAHQYPSAGITQAWTLVHDKYIKPVRYFDNHERAIEYQPGESIHGHVERDYSYRYQLISDTMLAKMTRQSVSGTGCDKVEVLTLKDDKLTMTLTWLPALTLIKDFTVTEANVTRHWNLASVDTAIDTAAFFNHRDSFQSTDYADIGDDHTDPFLTKMVTQGFIESGASGFYDQHGNALDGAGHAH